MNPSKIALALLLTLAVGLAVTVEEATVHAQKEKADPKLVPENLARGKQASASSHQDEGRGVDKGIDGDFDTRWCASNAEPMQWY
jgi:hypothetical protein